MDTNQELAKRAVSLCKRKGVDQAEALVVRRVEKTAEAFRQEVLRSGTSDTTSVILRLFRNHRGAVVVGRGSCEQMLDRMINDAVEMARYTSPDKFLGCADPKFVGRASGDLEIFDGRLARLPLSRVKEVALAAEASVVRKDARTKNLITSTFETQTEHVSLCASHGFCDSYQTTTATLLVKAVIDSDAVETGGQMPGGPNQKLAAHAGMASRSIDGIDMDKVAGRTIQRLLGGAGARQCPSGYYPVVFSPIAASFILSTLLVASSGSTARQLGKSILGEIGEQVCSPLVTILDDSAMPGGLGTVPFDNEGVRPGRNIVIENGVLKDFLLNSYYARSLQRHPTGNAMANEDTRFDVFPSNPYIDAGTSKPEDIISDVSQGFYVTRYLSYLMPLSANFAQAASGFWIENGKLTYPVRAATLSAGLGDMLKNICALGNDIDNGLRFNSPTLMVSEMNISPLS
jgi:PmbA protein